MALIGRQLQDNITVPKTVYNLYAYPFDEGIVFNLYN